MTTTKTKLNGLRDLTGDELSTLGENIHIAEFGLDFFDLEGHIQATLDYDGDYCVYYYSVTDRAYKPIDVPGIPFPLAKQLIELGFAIS
jgi:hypothetical protein